MSEDERVRCQCSYKNHRKKDQDWVVELPVSFCVIQLWQISAYLLGLGVLPMEMCGCKAGADEVWAGVIRMPVARCRSGMYRAEYTVGSLLLL